jgi:hypothetical protein
LIENGDLKSLTNAPTNDGGGSLELTEFSIGWDDEVLDMLDVYEVLVLVLVVVIVEEV